MNGGAASRGLWLGVGGLSVGQTVLNLHDIHNTGHTHTTYNIRRGIHGREEPLNGLNKHQMKQRSTVGWRFWMHACMRAHRGTQLGTLTNVRPSVCHTQTDTSASAYVQKSAPTRASHGVAGYLAFHLHSCSERSSRSGDLVNKQTLNAEEPRRMCRRRGDDMTPPPR